MDYSKKKDQRSVLHSEEDSYRKLLRYKPTSLGQPYGRLAHC